MTRRTAPAPTLLVLVAAACAGPDAGDGSQGPDAAPALTAAAAAPDFEPGTEERAAILGTVQALFDALGTGDAELLRSVVHSAIVMHSAEVGADGAVSLGSSTLDGLATRIETSEARLIERMWDAEVRVDGELATVWTPYDFYVGADLSHCGVDAATLVKREEGWQIVGLSWTRQQPPECALHPDGPPSG